MKIITVRGRGILIGTLVAAAVFFTAITATSMSAANAQLARIRSASLLLEAQALPALSSARQLATARAYHSAVHPAWKDLSAAEQVMRVGKIAADLLAAPATALPTPASFVGNRTAMTTSQNALALRRESDCSLTMVLGAYTFSPTASTALTVSTAGTPITHYERILHDDSGLS